MRKVDLYWKSNRDWWEYVDHIPTIRESAPPEAKASYEHYLKQTNGRMAFGFWEGMPYGVVTDSFEEFKTYKNEISKETVIRHIESLVKFLSSEPSFDLFDGEEHHSGIYTDGTFTFPVDFLRYYKRYDIGIPPEYEEYLKQGVQYEST